MKKVLGCVMVAMFLGLAAGSTAVAQDNQPGGPGATGSCVYCKKTLLPFSGVYTATCQTTNVSVGVGYRGCRVVTSWPGGSQDCEMSNIGSCSPAGGGGGGGFIP